MTSKVLAPTSRHLVLIADDEPDVHLISKMSLKNMRYQDKRLKFLNAHSGEEAVAVMRENPNVAVILLDVVMENDHAGLQACKAIREELKNPFVRILLRTGQPGAAPEQKVIQDYDIDGYLPKAELTSSRLFTSVRTSLKAHQELVELERHRQNLAAIHDCVVSLRPYEPVETALERILDTVATICPSDMAVLHLETFEEDGNPQQYFLYRATGEDLVKNEIDAEQVRTNITSNSEISSMRNPGAALDGFIVPFNIDHELGFGWIYVHSEEPDQMARHGLPLLAAHGSNVLYAAVTQNMMQNNDSTDLFEQMMI